MSNYKVKVNNEAESREVQELFFNLGYRWLSGCGVVSNVNSEYLYTSEDFGLWCGDYHSTFVECGKKELTIPQLKDLVVLKRNSIDDATHKCETINERLGFLSSDGVEYIWSYSGSKWFKPEEMNFKKFKLKPIIKPLKEYLVPQGNGKYALTKATEKRVSDWVEVPEGAEAYIINGDDSAFYKDDGDAQFDDGGWHCCNEHGDISYNDLETFLNYGEGGKVIWQRHTQPEELPFVDDEPKSLNDTYAEIEQVRQDNVNNPSHYSDSSIECIDAMEAMMTADQFIGYLRGNVFKYQWRYEKKNGIEDLKKAQWYLDKLVTKVNEK